MKKRTKSNSDDIHTQLLPNVFFFLFIHSFYISLTFFFYLSPQGILINIHYLINSNLGEYNDTDYIVVIHLTVDPHQFESAEVSTCVTTIQMSCF